MAAGERERAPVTRGAIVALLTRLASATVTRDIYLHDGQGAIVYIPVNWAHEFEDCDDVPGTPWWMSSTDASIEVDSDEDGPAIQVWAADDIGPNPWKVDSQYMCLKYLVRHTEVSVEEARRIHPALFKALDRCDKQEPLWHEEGYVPDVLRDLRFDSSP